MHGRLAKLLPGGPGPDKHSGTPVVAGTAPRGRICASKTFNFTQQYGPYNSCGHWKAHMSAGFVPADGISRSEALMTDVTVSGCGGTANVSDITGATVQSAAAAGSHLRLSKHQQRHRQRWQQQRRTSTDAAGAAAAAVMLKNGSCVRQPWFWKHCFLVLSSGRSPAHPECIVILTALPGGKGPRTPFFPYRKGAMVRRTYRQLMVMPKKTGNAIVDLHFQAAKVYIAAQLNHFAGVVMPVAVREAYVQLGRGHFAVYDDRRAAKELHMKPELQRQVFKAANVLADFVGGKLPGLPTCAALQKQLKHDQQTKQGLVTPL